MAFKRDHFAPVYITTTKAPSIFVYCSNEDSLADIMQPGYFSSMRIAIKANSMIDVVCVDAAVRLVVGRPEGLNVIIRPDYFLAKFAEEMEEIKPVKTKLSPQQRAAITRKKNQDALAKTG